jgi:uncharacterized Rossmann fold enzyme
MEKISKILAKNIELHRKIVASFRFNPYRDFLAGIELNNLLSSNLWGKLPGEDVVSVIGPSFPSSNPDGFVIVADSALKFYDGKYDMVVSDLDGPIERIIEEKKSIKVIHAHGDNIDKLRKYVPLLSGIVLGTTQSIPLHNVRNIGGFTDGDRSVIMATILGAKKVYIHGFDYSTPIDDPKDVKLKKLLFAKELIGKIKNTELVYVQK